MKTFNEFCVEAYQLNEGIPWKPVLKSVGLGFAVDAASDKITKLFPKPMQPGARKVLDVASWGALAPAAGAYELYKDCLLYTSPSPRDKRQSRMPSSA